jgi:hypothetical protein
MAGDKTARIFHEAVLDADRFLKAGSGLAI